MYCIVRFKRLALALLFKTWVDYPMALLRDIQTQRRGWVDSMDILIMALVAIISPALGLMLSFLGLKFIFGLLNNSRIKGH